MSIEDRKNTTQKSNNKPIPNPVKQNIKTVLN